MTPTSSRSESAGEVARPGPARGLARALWLACVPLATLIVTIALLVESTSIVGRDAIYPRAVLVALLLVSTIALVRELLLARHDAIDDGDDGNGDDGGAEGARGRGVAWSRVGIAVVTLAAMPLLLPTAGYIVSTAVLTAGVTLALGLRSVRAAVALTLGVTVASYVLFVIVLGARIPPGVILP